MKKIFVIVSVIFLCVATYAEGDNVTDISKSGGRLIKTGKDKGETGYASATKEQWDEWYNGELTRFTRIVCEGRGRNTCKFDMSLPPKLLDDITRTLHSYIDMGHTTGRFEIEGFICTWSDGDKEEDEEETGAFIYRYKLVIKNKTTIAHTTIQVSPNPIQHTLSILFSVPINAMMNVKIVDVNGNIRWNANMDVVGEVLVLPENAINTLQLGTYYVICTNNDYTANAPFVKQ